MARAIGDNPVWDAVADGAVTMTTSFAALPSVTCGTGGMVCFSAAGANTGKILIGAASGATGGIELAAGEKSPWVPITNLNLLSAKSSIANDTLYYFILK